MAEQTCKHEVNESPLYCIKCGVEAEGVVWPAAQPEAAPAQVAKPICPCKSMPNELRGFICSECGTRYPPESSSAPQIPVQPKMADDPITGPIRRALVDVAIESAKRRGITEPDINCVYTAAIHLLSASQAALAAERERKDRAYTERDHVVCALSKLFPASLERHPDSDESWEDDWRWIVFIDLPTGQATWHIHDSELQWFDHLPRFTGRIWDGHTTEQKYERLRALPIAAADQELQAQRDIFEAYVRKAIPLMIDAVPWIGNSALLRRFEAFLKERPPVRPALSRTEPEAQK